MKICTFSSITNYVEPNLNLMKIHIILQYLRILQIIYHQVCFILTLQINLLSKVKVFIYEANSKYLLFFIDSSEPVIIFCFDLMMDSNQIVFCLDHLIRLEFYL